MITKFLESLVKQILSARTEANDRTARCQSMSSFLARKEGNNFEKNKKKVKKLPQRTPCSVQGRFVWCMMFNTYKYSSMFKGKKREPAFDHIKLRPRN